MTKWTGYFVLFALGSAYCALMIGVAVWVGSLNQGLDDRDIGRQQVYYHMSAEMFQRWRSCMDVASYNGESRAVACDSERAALDLVLQNSDRSKLVGDDMYRYIHDPADGPLDETGMTYSVDEAE